MGSSTEVDVYETFTSDDVYYPDILKSILVTSTDKTLYKSYAATPTRWNNIEKVGSEDINMNIYILILYVKLVAWN